MGLSYSESHTEMKSSVEYMYVRHIYSDKHVLASKQSHRYTFIYLFYMVVSFPETDHTLLDLC